MHTLLALGAAAALSLAACGGGAPAAAPGGSGLASAPAHASASPVAASAQAPTVVKVGSQNVAGNAALYIAQDRGYFKQQGLDVQYVDVGLTEQMIPPLATGQVDAILVGIQSGVLNAIARDVNIKIVGDSGEISPDPKNGFSSAFAFAISKQSAESGKIKTFADLKGKVYGTTGSGGTTALIALERGLQSAGLTLNDITTKQMTFADLPAAVGNGSVDFGLAVEPFAAQGEAKGLWVRWKNGADLYPGGQVAALYYGPHMAQLGSDVGTRFMVAYTRGIRDYYEAFGPQKKDRAAIVTILTRNTAVKDPALYDKMTWNYMNPDCSIQMQTFRNDLDWYASHGFAQKLEFDRVVDDSYCQAAVKELGPYRG
jgi:NitT/TauT family transport system substrate-binding protein